MLEAEAAVRGSVPGLSRVYVQGVVTAAALNFMGSSAFFYISLIRGHIVVFQHVHLVPADLLPPHLLRGLNYVLYGNELLW